MVLKVTEMRRKRVEFHKLRFPEQTGTVSHISESQLQELYAEIESRRNHEGTANYHQRKQEFLNWFENHKAQLESPGFKSYYVAQEQAKEEKHRNFTALHHIQIDYTYSLTSVADWQTVLERSYKDETALLNLAREFLIEIAIHESAFLQKYGEEFKAVAFTEWSQKNSEHLRAMSVIMTGGLSLDSRQDQELSRAILNDARARATQQNLSSEQLQLMHQEVKRISGTGTALELARTRASVIAHHIREKGPEQRNPPWLLDGMRRALHEWHDEGRQLDWDSLALREIQESNEFLELIGQHIDNGGSKEEEDYAEYLWNHNEHGFYMP